MGAILLFITSCSLSNIGTKAGPKFHNLGQPLSEQFLQFCRFTSTSKGFLSSNSNVLPLNCKFESTKLISCLFCPTFEISNSS